ncbi:unnamed protein product, partial [marine sediment metagenome]
MNLSELIFLIFIVWHIYLNVVAILGHPISNILWGIS